MGAIVANRYLNSMGGSLIGTSVLTTSLMNIACLRLKNKGSIPFGTVWYKGTDR